MNATHRPYSFSLSPILIYLGSPLCWLFFILHFPFEAGSSATQPQPWIFRHTTKSIISRMTAILFPMQHYPPTRHKFCNYLVCGLLMAAEWILKEVYIPTIPINYQESPNQCWFVSATSLPSNFQRNTIPPLAIKFAINWSVGYWWRRSGYWKKSTFQLFPSSIKKVLSITLLDKALYKQQPSNFKHTTIQSVWSRRCSEPPKSLWNCRCCRRAAAIIVEPPPLLWSRHHCCWAAAIVVEPPPLWFSHHRYHGAAAILVETPPLLWSCHHCHRWHAAVVIVELPPLSWSRRRNPGAITVVVEPLPL